MAGVANRMLCVTVRSSCLVVDGGEGCGANVAARRDRVNTVAGMAAHSLRPTTTPLVPLGHCLAADHQYYSRDYVNGSCARHCDAGYVSKANDLNRRTCIDAATTDQWWAKSHADDLAAGCRRSAAA